MSAFLELKIIGARPKWTSQFGQTFAISRDLSGQWFLCTKNGFHRENERVALPLSSLPFLRQTLKSYESLDTDLRKNGGRVFVNTKGIHRKK